MAELQIYVLSLSDGKWYIGKTTDAMARLQQHMSGEGSAWTRKYKPLRIEEIIPGDAFDEDKVTKRYMSKYGIDNVRGGSYVTIELNDQQRQMLQKEINMAEDKCALCGKSGHFIKDCPVNQPAKNCDRCGRNGHLADKCYAKTDANGKYIKKTVKQEPVAVVVAAEEPAPVLCERCGRNGHLADKCYAKTDANGKQIEIIVVEEEKIPFVVVEAPTVREWGNFCRRCGRNGHSAEGCSIKSDIDGHYIKKVGNILWCEKCGVKGHSAYDCSLVFCSRCGRTNHVLEKCYAATDIDNRTLLPRGNEYVCKVCKDLIYYSSPCDHSKIRNDMMRMGITIAEKVRSDVEEGGNCIIS